ncbi:helix-turn-helix domain-containing protein [Enterobacter chuandaensis]|uniref:Helix-turn-helix domain-containing protein n=1 Tax=Enterobacter chuandaensis TaxID=2497875 RepID=A0AA96M7N2_9ENTR|nr:helix-turn-helix domain-containing protein [Enterobacter chuandaensis]MCW4781862.1 helix-turn-helix domain-containing protein [Enterobacter chuandaensis]MDA4759714.1 helix-turn-helix domain-containing protein [Enterobacter chuandaensis]WNS39090.1 helix-turn-helix domain-containing protein [Enterobacter chuandaensis]
MKPENYIIKLIHELSEPARVKLGRQRQIISLDQHEEPMTFILHSGIAAVYRTRDQLLLKFIEAPMIVGMNDLIDTNAGFYMQACGEIKYEIKPLKSTLEIINNRNLWQEAAYSYMYAIKRLLEAHETSVGLSTYELIRLNLVALMTEKEELRLAVNACDYIQEKTHLSRSRIMKILSDLKAGGYIDVERGILMSIHRLPDNY